MQPGLLAKLRYLDELSLNRNDISWIEFGLFIGLNNLATLRLHENKISVLEPGSFTGLNSLTTLYLHDNKVTVIQSGSFDGLKCLAQLSPNLTDISETKNGTFTGLNIVKFLYLHNNEISSVENGAFDPLHSIKYISLFNNKLTTLHPDVFVNIPRYPLQLQLSDQITDTQDWDCSSLCWLKHEEKHQTVKFQVEEKYLPRCANGSAWSSLMCLSQGEWSTIDLLWWYQNWFCSSFPLNSTLCCSSHRNLSRTRRGSWLPKDWIHRPLQCGWLRHLQL